jgi:hypothetical protein
MPTVIGALVGFTSAIFSEPLRRWIYRPKIKLYFGEEEEYNARTPEEATIIDPEKSAVPFQSIHDAIYVRIKAVNVNYAIAKSCRAYLYSVEMKDKNDNYVPTIYCESIPLAWSCRDKQAYDPYDLSRDVVQFIDLISTRSISSDFRVEIKPMPYRYMDIFKQHGTYRFNVQVSGENIKPNYIKIIFKWDGSWDKYKAKIDA